MSRPAVALIACLLSAGCASRQPLATIRGPAVDGRQAWAWMQSSLPGSWTAEADGGRSVLESFRLVSNGTALVETFTTPSGHETVTVYHPDGNGLMLTHYCAQGNQPRLRMVDSGAGRARFAFADATNLRPDQAVMIERVLQLRGDGFEQTETYRQPDGAGETTTFRFVREPAARP